MIDDAPEIEPSARMETLSRSECFTLLATHDVGRLAIERTGEAPFVVPVNYALDGEAVVFRTAPGTKLSLLRHAPVAFEVDEVDGSDGTAWSVVVEGPAYEATHWETDHVAVRPLTGGPKGHAVRIEPKVVSGRRLLAINGFGFDDQGYLS